MPFKAPSKLKIAEILTLKLDHFSGGRPEARAEVSKIELQAFGRTAREAKPVIEAIMADAQDAARALAEAYVMLAAVSHSTRGGAYELTRLRAALSAAMGYEKLIPFERERDVPDDIAEALGALSGKGPALPVRLPRTIGMP